MALTSHNSSFCRARLVASYFLECFRNTGCSFELRTIILSRVSRPMELHHRPLVEPSVKLSPHSAPIRQTHQSFRAASVRGDPRGSEPVDAGTGSRPSFGA